MGAEKLSIYKTPKLDHPKMVLGFSGWMNGGEVSIATINWLVAVLNANLLGLIEPQGFYIYNMPGTMETAILMRPYVRVNKGVIQSIEMPGNTFYYSQKTDLILFIGKEPNLNWEDFAQCILSICHDFGVHEVYFIGSVAGVVPHTREPTMMCSVSDIKMKQQMEKLGFKLTTYEGPASFATYFMARAAAHGMTMANLVATVPAYVQGENPKCIEAALRVLGNLLSLPIDLETLREMSDDFEKRLTEIVKQMPELEDNIKKLEEIYDNDIFEHEMDDLKTWLEQQGLSLD